MPIHDWTRVSAGTFHDFHTAWIVALRNALNGGLLPPDYYAMAEQRANGISPDVLTFKTSMSDPADPAANSPPGTVAVLEAPPRVALRMSADANVAWAQSRRTLVIRHASDHDIVALLEIASPANKDRPTSVADFVDKALSALRLGYHLLVADLFPPGRHDPHGLNGAIWEHFQIDPYVPPRDMPLTVAAYAVRGLPEAFFEPLGVGFPLRDMPLFLTGDHYIEVPLEATYDEAWRGVPPVWKQALEG